MRDEGKSRVSILSLRTKTRYVEQKRNENKIWLLHFLVRAFTLVFEHGIYFVIVVSRGVNMATTRMGTILKLKQYIPRIKLIRFISSAVKTAQ